MSVKEWRETMERLASIPEGEERLIAATGRYIGEGFDDPRLDTLFLAMPFSWKGTIVQYAGRLHRTHSGKHEVRVYDYVDARVPQLLKMHKKRLRGFHAIGYSMDRQRRLLNQEPVFVQFRADFPIETIENLFLDGVFL